MHPRGFHERDVISFMFKVEQGYGCSCHGVSNTLCSQFLDFSIYFYVTVPFQIHFGSICVMLHHDSSFKFLVEDYLINLCHFTHMPLMQYVFTTFCCFLGDRDLLGNWSALPAKTCFDISVWYSDFQSLLLVALGIFGLFPPIICPVKCSVQYKQSKCGIFCHS